MKKTVKNLVNLLELYREHPYRELIARLAHDDWDKYLLHTENLLEDSRVQFIGVFSNGWLHKPIQITVFTHASADNQWHCFLRIDNQLYKVAPKGSTTIEKD